MTLAFDALDAPLSPFSRIDARWKLGSILISILAAAALATPIAVGAAFALAMGMLILARLPRRLVATRLGAFAIFLLPFAAVLVITDGVAGVGFALVLAGRALTIACLGLVLVATSSLVQTMQAAESLGVPRILARIMLMSYRYTFVLADEFARIRVALRTRGYRNRPNLHSYRTLGQVTGTLFVRGTERAERVAHAMRCRGFDGRFHPLTSPSTKPRDLLFAGIVLGMFLGCLALDLVIRFQ